MNDSKNQNEAAQFDRLVDDELSAVERQQLLASLDDRPEGWRRCALAFLEAQAWGQEFRAVLAEPVSGGSSGNVAMEIVQGQACSGLPRWKGRWKGRWLAIAASLLLAFSLGKFASTSQPASKFSNDQLPNDIAVVEQEDSPLHAEELPATLSDDFVTLLVRDTSGQDRRMQVPLREVKSMNPQPASMSPELRSRFREQGVDVQRRRRFASIFFEQGDRLVPMMVPVDDTYLVPANNLVF